MTPSWQLALYAAGDGDLSGYVQQNLDDVRMAAPGVRSTVRVLADLRDQWVREDWAGGVLADRQTGTALNMGDESTLGGFVARPWDGPRAVVIAGHGTGWSGREEPQGFVSSDRSHDDQLTIAELVRVAAESRPFDLLGFDACLMAGIEVFSLLGPHARILVGSATAAPGGGWPYQRVLAALDESDGAESLARGILRAFGERYPNPPPGHMAHLVAVRGDRMAAVRAALDTFGEAALDDAVHIPLDALVATLPRVARPIARGFQARKTFEVFGELAPEGSRTARAVTTFLEALDAAVLDEVCLPAEAAPGLSLYLGEDGVVDEYAERMGRSSGWVRFLRRAWRQDTATTPTSPPISRHPVLKSTIEANLAAWKGHLGRGSRSLVPGWVVGALLARTEDALQRQDGERAAGAILDLLRQLDEQRRSAAQAKILSAADALAAEVHEHLFEAARSEGRLSAGKAPVRPVAWIESIASPLTWNRDRRVLLPGLGDGTSVNLPFQVVIVPTDHVERPWRLLSVLHEVGHEVDRVIGLSSPLAAALPDPWSGWAQELVADVLALGVAGPSYVRCVDWVLRATPAWSARPVAGGRHPPAALRLALLEHLSGEGRRYADALGSDHEREVFAAVVDRADAFAPIRAIGRPMTAGFVGAVRDSVSWAETDEPEPSDASSRAFVDTIRVLTPPPGALNAGEAAFVAGQGTRFAPASIDVQGSLLKAPRPDLMLAADHMFFVGALQEQLLPVLSTAAAERRTRWRTVEVFFLGRDDDLPLLYPGRSQEELVATRDRVRRELVTVLGDLADNWRVYPVVPGYLFGSFYLQRDLDGHLPDAWYVHTSAPVWGRGIRGAPSTDYRSVSGDLTGDPEIRTLVEGLESLRATEPSAWYGARLRSLLPVRP